VRTVGAEADDRDRHQVALKVTSIRRRDSRAEKTHGETMVGSVEREETARGAERKKKPLRCIGDMRRARRGCK